MDLVWRKTNEYALIPEKTVVKGIPGSKAVPKSSKVESHKHLLQKQTITHKDLKQPTITQEEEKIALILLLTSGFMIYCFDSQSGRILYTTSIHSSGWIF